MRLKRLGNTEIGELEKILELSGQTFWIVAFDGTILDVYGALDSLLGFSADELRGSPLRDIIEPEDLKEAARQFQNVAESGPPDSFEIELRVSSKGGELHDVKVNGTLASQPESDQAVIFGLTTDITRQKLAERSLDRERLRFFSTFEHAPSGIVLVHIDEERGGLIKGVNAEARRLAGRDEDGLVGQWLTDGELVEIDDDALAKTLADSQAMLGGESAGFSLYRLLKRPDDTRINVRIVVSPLKAEDWELDTELQPINAIAHIEDVTEQRLAQEQLQHQARHDSLTDLLNRGWFISILTDRLDRGVKGHGGGALLMIDLDDFKQVNDSHGHHAGDGVLREIARILISELRDTDLVSRLGGDEFAVLLPKVDEPGAVRVAESLLACLAKSKIEISESGGEHYLPGVSIGLLMLDGRDVDPESALRDCDRAMYEAKRQGGARYVKAPV